MDLPSQARVVVIGGGIAGCSVAYHLAESGWSDVVLIERNTLSSGTTWHAAGGMVVPQTSGVDIRFVQDSLAVYSALSEETGQNIGLKHSGALNLVQQEGRRTELQRLVAFYQSYGGNAEIISPAEAGRINPFVRTDDVIGAFHTPDAYRVNPADVVQAVAKGARARGVRIIEHTRVTDIETARQGRLPHVEAVLTDKGRITCEVMILACGAWSRDVGRLAGISVPLHAVAHSYLVTEQIDGMIELPVTRDHDAWIYARDEVGGLLVGWFEPKAQALAQVQLPDDFSFASLPEDWDHLGPHVEQAIHRHPVLEQAGIKLLFTGPESFTPDANCLIGPAPGLHGAFVMAGFNSQGISHSGGAGKALAEWIIEGEPTFDTAHFDIRRYPRVLGNTAWLADRGSEMPSWIFGIAWPRREHESGRGLRHSPIHAQLEKAGARFGEIAGWECANWFAPGESAADDPPTFGKPGWFDTVAAEHKSARETVALIDHSPMNKLLVQGSAAGPLLQRLCAIDVMGDVGSLVSTAMLNQDAGIDAIVTVVRRGETEFLILTGATMGVRIRDRLERHASDTEHLAVTDISGGYGILTLIGPSADDLLGTVTEGVLSEVEFPEMTAREFPIGPATALALRRSTADLPAWELLIPSDTAVAAYEAVCRAGKSLDLRHAGAYMSESLRLENGTPSWGRDVSRLETPFETGLDALVQPDKQVPFVGQESLLQLRGQRPKKRLVRFVLDGVEAWPQGREPIWRDGTCVGHVTTAAFGHSIGKMLAFGYVSAKGAAVDDGFIFDGRYEIEIADRRFAAIVATQ